MAAFRVTEATTILIGTTGTEILALTVIGLIIAIVGVTNRHNRNEKERAIIAYGTSN